MAGYLFARVSTPITQRITDAPSAIIMQFAGTFTVWIVAEHIGLSGILTIVAYAITIARTAPARTPARLRVPSYAVWETVVFVLNVLAFVLIGCSSADLVAARRQVRLKYCAVAAAVLAVVIFDPHRLGDVIRRRPAALIARGLLHSACARCGADGRARHRRILVRDARHRHAGGGVRAARSFPYRDLMLLTAFAVVLGSLVIQGLTLRPLIVGAATRGGEPGGLAKSRAPARIAYRAALDEIDGDPSEEAEILRLEYRALLLRAESEPDGGVASGELPADPLRRRAIAAARRIAAQAAPSEEIGDDAFHQLEEELDCAELSAQG